MDAAELISKLGAHAYKARVVSIKRVAELEDIIRKLNQQGSFSPQFYRKELIGYLSFDYGSVLPEAKSIIVIAAPQPPARVYFGQHAVIIPPTYIYGAMWQGTLKLLTEILAPRGYRVARARLPFKTLAVRSGLGRYGRNNICYVAGMGSFHRLGAFYSDMPCEEDTWQEARALKTCEGCLLCMESCPTGCIKRERFLVDAQNCLTYFNENEADFPGWVKREWHNALIGCLFCQKVCPLNKGVVDKIELAEVFTEEETTVILAKSPFDSLALETQAKIKKICMDDYYSVLPRNLSALIQPSA